MAASMASAARVAKPGLQDRGVGPPVAIDAMDDELVGVAVERAERRSDRRRPTTAGTTRTGAARRGTARAAVARAAAGRELAPGRRAWRSRCRRSHGSRSPRNAVARRSAVGAAPPGRRDGDDDAAVGVDDDPQRRGLAASGAGCRRAGRPGRCDRRPATLVDRAALEPLTRRGAAGGPARSPVSTPSRIASRPLTMTCSMPAGWRAGSAYVASSATVAGSKTTRSAIAPSRTTPRSRSPSRPGRHRGQLRDGRLERQDRRARARTCRAPGPCSRRSADAAARRRGCGWPGRRPSASVQTAIQGTAMIVSTSASSMQWITIETSSRSSTSASKATSAGSRAEPSPSSAQRPAGPVRVAGRVRDDDAAPAGVGGHVLPARDAALDLGPDQVAHVEVGQRGDAGLHAERQQRRRQDRGQGRGRGRVRILVGGRRPGPRPGPPPARATASPARPHTARAPHLRCETCSRAAAPRRRPRPGPRRSTRRATRTARPPRCACASRTGRRAGSPRSTSAAISSGPACMPGA